MNRPSPMRASVARICLVLASIAALGCSGLIDTVRMVADSRFDQRLGDDAVHPNDFVIPPPPWGERIASHDLALGGLQTRMVWYQLPDDIDDDRALDFCAEAIAAAGLPVVRDVVEGDPVVSSGVSVFATIEAKDGLRALNLTQMTEVH